VEGFDGLGGGRRGPKLPLPAARVGIYPIVTFEQQLLNMIGNLV
jgi:hypothetical protein